MSNLRDQLWPVFIAEVSEQVEGLDTLLDPATGASGGDVNALFRHFHTIKSNGSMLDFEAMEQLANACEDLLFVLRENNLAVDARSTSLMVRSVDAIKQQLDHITRYRENPPVDENLLTELFTYVACIKNPESDPAAATPTENAFTESVQTTYEQDTETMRINSRTLDDLVSSVGNMAMRENMFSHVIRNESVEQLVKHARTLMPRMKTGLLQQERDTLRHLLEGMADYHSRAIHADQSVQLALSRIEQDVLDLRVVPIAIVFNRLPHLVRKTSEHSRKQVNIVMEGADVRIDKRMVDTLMEPLVHIIRNAIDHGIETPEERKRIGKNEVGVITVRAEQDSGMLLLEISDDGKGLDARKIIAKAKLMGLISTEKDLTSPEKINQLIFLPGFSTSDAVTETSGRGVGMDVVKTKITMLGGRADVSSTENKGTSFRIHLPLSVAIQSVLLVKIMEQSYAIPLRSVSEIIPLAAHDLQTVCGQTALLFRKDTLPVYSLASLIGQDDADEINLDKNIHREIVVIKRQDEWLGIMVDHVIGQQELIVREVHSDLSQLPGLGGISLLGNGHVIIILDSDHLFGVASSQARKINFSDSNLTIKGAAA